MITATQAQKSFCKKILIENKDIFSQIDILITQAIHKGNSKIVIKYTDDLSKDINDNILEVLKIYRYDISTWYVHKIITSANGIPHVIDEPAGYIISWKV